MSILKNYLLKKDLALLQISNGGRKNNKLGVSGAGKTYLGCSFCIAACCNFYTVKYVRLPDLLNELGVARGVELYCKNYKYL